jgi:hypothetical protein
MNIGQVFYGHESKSGSAQIILFMGKTEYHEAKPLSLQKKRESYKHYVVNQCTFAQI